MSFKLCMHRSLAPAPFFRSARATTMPLRAKIMNSAVAGQRQASSNVEIPKELPDDPADDVLFSKHYSLRTIQLNRPKKLNSLDGSMVRKIIPRLVEWEKSDMANVVIMKGAGEKSLCAGGDVGVLAGWNKEGPEGKQRSKDYFGLEYKLDHLIATYSKPYIAFMDGITMGGGVGLSVHAPFRIATERTVFAMPETTIGFFPEVGGSFFLPRMDGAMGTYLALTSDRLQGVNAYFHGVSTHYLHSSSLPDLENRLAELNFKDYDKMEERLKIINSTIEEFVTGLPHDQQITLTGDTRKAIDRCFSKESIEQILEALDAEGNDWAAKTKKTILQRSPTSLKVTLREMQLGKKFSIAEAFRREYEIAAHFMEHHDFTEGVSARLLRKPAEEPKWQPASLDEVSDATVDGFFRLPEGQDRLQLLNSGPGSEYMKYPHAWIGLPTEEDVKKAANGQRSRQQLVDGFVQGRGGKAGVKEKVTEIVERKTKEEDGKAIWVE